MRATISPLALLFYLLFHPATPLLSVSEPQSNEAGSAASAAESEERVELNTADQAALETLPGIGPRTAERIIEYRNENGAFEKVEDLMNVRGIGERTFLRLRELVRIETSDGQQ